MLLLLLSTGCDQKETKGDSFTFTKHEPSKRTKASELVDLTNKGVGPIASIALHEQIDTILVAQGKKLYGQKCTTCHMVGSTFIGPPPNRILERRTPEWVMNMMLNPTGMIRKDSLAKALFMEFNGQLMTDQNLAEADARAILEYFRTLD